MEKADKVSRQPELTDFRRAARYHQAVWRERRNYPMGTQPYKGGEGARPLGSRLPVDWARDTGANFIDPRVAGAVVGRLAAPQVGQTLRADRLYADLLSSMPFCFNLFGTLNDAETATRAVKAWWPDVPGRVTDVIFEWSPGRADATYLGNRSAFDVAFILELETGGRGVLGIETKYHERPEPVSIRPTALPRYLEVSERSGAFIDGAAELLPHETCSQLWLDHLLGLSTLQHPSGDWQWARFVLVYPDGNPAWAPLAVRYESLLAETSTFATTTFDQLMAADALDPQVQRALIERYRCWST